MSTSFGPVGSSAGGLPGVSNFIPGAGANATLAKWRRARSRVLAGTGNATVLCIGDSLTAGAGSTAGGSSMGSNAKSKAWPPALARFLTARGLNASWQNWMGGGGNTPGLGANTWTDYDARISMGTASNSGIGTIGSNVLQLPGSGGKCSFTPIGAVDTVVPYALQTGTNLAVSIDGGTTTLQTVTIPNSGGHLVRKSVAISLGAAAQRTITVTAPNNGAFLTGMIAYNSAVPEVTVIGAGWFGSTTADWVGPNWAPLDGVLEIAPDLTIVALSFNDIAATPIATYRTNLQAIVTAAKTSGDVIVTLEQIGQSVDPNTLVPFRAAVQAVALANGCPAVDITAIWGTDYSAFATAFGSGDGVHCSAAGYADVGAVYQDLLLAA